MQFVQIIILSGYLFTRKTIFLMVKTENCFYSNFL